MRHVSIGILALVLTLTTSAMALGQASNSENLMVGLRLNGVGWTVNDLRVNSERGIGGSVAVGYGISDLATVFAELSAVRVTQDGGDDYGLGHLDAGARFTFFSTARALRPFAEIGLAIRTAAWEDAELGTVDVLGPGATFGGGVLYYLNPTLALEGAFKMTLGDMTDVTVEDRNFETEYHGRSVRLLAGVTWYPIR